MIFESYIIRSEIIQVPDDQLTLNYMLPNNLKFGPRLYQGSTDGYRASDFHRKCDNKGKTFTIIRSDKGNIFGAFTDLEWASRDQAITGGKNSFLFALNEDKSFA